MTVLGTVRMNDGERPCTDLRIKVFYGASKLACPTPLRALNPLQCAARGGRGERAFSATGRVRAFHAGREVPLAACRAAVRPVAGAL